MVEMPIILMYPEVVSPFYKEVMLMIPLSIPVPNPLLELIPMQISKEGRNKLNAMAKHLMLR